MRSTLYLKFIVIYIIFGFLSIFTVATLTSQIISTRLERETGEKLYKEAALIASEYMPGYFTETLSSSDVQVQMNGMKTYLESDIWLTDIDGKLLRSSQRKSSPVRPTEIADFNPAETGNSQYIIGDYHGYFPEDVITVIMPVTQGSRQRDIFLSTSRILIC